MTVHNPLSGRLFSPAVPLDLAHFLFLFPLRKRCCETGACRNKHEQDFLADSSERAAPAQVWSLQQLHNLQISALIPLKWGSECESDSSLNTMRGLSISWLPRVEKMFVAVAATTAVTRGEVTLSQRYHLSPLSDPDEPRFVISNREA